MKKLYTLSVLLLGALSINAQTVLYSNDFEDGVGDATIVGSGEIVAAENAAFGNVFHNAKGGQAIRANYLLLPDNVFADLQAADIESAGIKELTISFWVNKGTDAANQFTPIFSAYGAVPVDGANSWPMMVLQSRLLGQINCAGWTNFTNEENVKFEELGSGANKESVEWLQDDEWHFYAATFTPTEVIVFVDGIAQNTWAFSEVEGNRAQGIFTNGSDLKYISLGGNQAWDFEDVDPAFMFDDLVIYADALTTAEMDVIMAAKMPTSINNPEVDANGSIVSEAYFSITGTQVGSEFEELAPGIYIKRAVYSNGAVKSSKIVKANR